MSSFRDLEDRLASFFLILSKIVFPMIVLALICTHFSRASPWFLKPYKQKSKHSASEKGLQSKHPWVSENIKVKTLISLHRCTS